MVQKKSAKGWHSGTGRLVALGHWGGKIMGLKWPQSYDLSWPASSHVRARVLRASDVRAASSRVVCWQLKLHEPSGHDAIGVITNLLILCKYE